MKRLKLVYATCLAVWFVGVFWFMKNAMGSTVTAIVSPLPPFLTISMNDQVSTIDVWNPSIQKVNDAGILKPSISAKAALVYDVSTSQPLFVFNARKRLPMASLTKVMTAIIALENKRDDDRYVVAQDDLVGENSMGLTNGEVLSLEELLYGVILVSGNDASETLARNYPGGREKFITAMNNKAKSLGLTDTHFTNPTGLEGDGDQYSTAYDLFVITKYGLEKFSLFRTVVAAVDHTILYTKDHKAFYLTNETNLLTSYPGVRGVKTGYTPEADLCLITYLEYDGHKLIAVLLGSTNRREEMKELLDYSLLSLDIPPPKHK